jgi:hypothetical protein
MKKILLPVFILICLAGLLATGCTGLGFIVGTGPIVNKTYDNKDFSEVEVANAFEYEITQSNAYSVLITTHENIIEYLDISQSGKTLYIRLKSGRYTTSDIKATITMPELERLNITGASRGSAKGFKSANPLEISTSGASQLDLDIEAGSTTADVSGASKITGSLKAGNTILTISGASRCELTGSANAANINVSGASHLDAPNFQMQNANVKVSGASHATIFTEGDLSIDASGASSVSYSGHPTIRNLDVSGASKVNGEQ